jgi:uncharacterized protein
MVPTSLNERTAALTPADRETLLTLAQTSIKHGLSGKPVQVDVAQHTTALRAPGASFVTLTIVEELRGCIGSLEAERALVEDVALNAFAAAFRDPRFSVLTWPEFERLRIHISLLSRPEPMRFASEADLLQQLQPGVDGLVLQEHWRRATFLPAVWNTLPEPIDFLRLITGRRRSRASVTRSIRSANPQRVDAGQRRQPVSPM